MTTFCGLDAACCEPDPGCNELLSSTIPQSVSRNHFLPKILDMNVVAWKVHSVGVGTPGPTRPET